ncbi:hypothetical protein KIN20_010276 [Parelaphostrongylus tenuis]|uniref:Uncharacterized protein n=1 Tax=Parelaphostrongylus tenuis TaxID=148309 RepID=A0AAD5M9F7_PARTN|nr:hypothetical protein KIN20_010276 [Parelaphostrongylus tenuis]
MILHSARDSSIQFVSSLTQRFLPLHDRVTHTFTCVASRAKHFCPLGYRLILLLFVISHNHYLGQHVTWSVIGLTHRAR